MIALVAVGEEAVVARRLAVFGRPFGVSSVHAGVRIEMADIERLPRDGCQHARVEQPPQYPGAPLRCFEEHQQASILRARERVGTELGLLKLKVRLNAALQSSLKRGH